MAEVATSAIRPGTEVGEQTPRKSRLHVYAKVSLVCALIAFWFNAMAVVSALAATQGVVLILPPDDLAVRGFAITPLCSLATFCLAVDAAIKYRWPGHTAHAQARKPQRRDLLVVTIAVGLTIVNLAFVVTLLFLWD